jgi:hypothetical protein
MSEEQEIKECDLLEFAKYMNSKELNETKEKNSYLKFKYTICAVLKFLLQKVEEIEDRVKRLEGIHYTDTIDINAEVKLKSTKMG